MSTSKHLHIFKPGRQTAMSGAVLDFSESDLAASARAYDPALHEAPIVIGHPKHDAPAYGWVKSLAASGDGLNAEPHQVDADFAELVASGRYKKISASFYLPDAPNNPVPGVYYLRHVGFLGAMPPAVKGLKQAEFADAEEGVVEFGDWDDIQSAGLWRRMREWLIGRFGLDEADKVIPDYTVANLESSARQEEELPASFSDPTDVRVSPTQPTHEENHAVTPEQKAALEAENAQLKQQLAAAKAEKQAADDAERHKNNVDFAEGLVSKGVLAPKHKGAVVALLDLAAKPGTDGQPVDFSEGDTKHPLTDVIKGFLGDMPKVVEFGETATKDKAGKGGSAEVAEFAEKSTDPDRLSLHVRATGLSAEKGIPYEQAVRQLL